MGDTGSLALGGALGAIAVTTHHELVLAIVGGLFVLEAVSVIIQVFSTSAPASACSAWRRSTIISSTRLGRADPRDPLLDHQLRARAGGAGDVDS